MSKPRQFIAVALLFVGVTGGAILIALAFLQPADEPVRATVLPEPRSLPAFSLVDHRGDPFAREDLAGDWQLLFFGFTHCPDICPATLQQLAIARDRVVGDGGRFPGIVLVSVDPERDSPARLSGYVSHFGDSVTGLTGSIESLTALTKPLGIYFAKTGDAADDYSVDHSTVVLLLDDQARWRAVFGAPHDVDSFVTDVRLLMDSG